MTVLQNWTFLKHFLKSPSSVGSITPSSPSLTKAMVSAIDWANVNSVVELGAGTGVLTAAIEKHRRADSVFLVGWYEGLFALDAGDRFDRAFWDRVLSARVAVSRHLEAARQAGANPTLNRQPEKRSG